MASAQKDTIYIDVDDEITTIIEKLQNSPHKIVALVLPKRAAVLQSVVNMKLLKRSAENSKKNVVLITGEAGLLPLAGATGMFVASSLQSKPEIPPAPDDGSAPAEPDEEDTEDIDDTDADTDEEADESVSERLTKKPASSSAAKKRSGAAAASAFSEPETIELDNDDIVEDAAAGAAGAAAAKKAKKNKKLMIPNFNKFRLVLMLGILGVILLGVGFIWANSALPKAVVTLQTDSSDVDTDADLTLDPKATEFDPAALVLPAKIATTQQKGSQQVSTTGQKNNGTKANGSVVLTAKVCGVSLPVSVPAGTGVSNGGKTFITQSNTNFSNTGTNNGACFTYPATSTTTVIAQAAGADYNIGAGDFTVAGRSDVTGKSSDAMSGGTDNIVKVVTQSDIDSAKQKIAANNKDTSPVKSELSKNLSTEGFKGINESFQAGEPTATPSAAVGDQTDTVTVSTVTTYTLYGAKEADLKKVITLNVETQIDKKKERILKDGFAQARYEIAAPATSGPLQLRMSATSLAGPDIDIDTLATQLTGKKTGEVKDMFRNVPGVSSVEVKYSPFWVSKVPKKADRVTIVIEKTGDTADNKGAKKSGDD